MAALIDNTGLVIRTAQKITVRITRSMTKKLVQFVENWE